MIRRSAREVLRPPRSNALVYMTTRALLHQVFTIVFSLERSGHTQIPISGPVILAANHRSVLDPIVVGLLVRRPVYYMAKQELFNKRRHAWFLSALGGFPVRRGGGDHHAIEVAHDILERGDCLVIFPEGKCVPPGPLGQPHRGVGRLALATGATVVPIAIAGTETPGARGFPRCPIRAQVGRPLPFPTAERPITPEAARLATQRIWASIATEWETLSGRASGRWGGGATMALRASALRRRQTRGA